MSALPSFKAFLTETIMDLPLTPGSGVRATLHYDDASSQHSLDMRFSKNPRLLLPQGNYRFTFTINDRLTLRAPGTISGASMRTVDHILTAAEQAANRTTALPMETIFNADVELTDITVEKDDSGLAQYVVRVFGDAR